MSHYPTSTLTKNKGKWYVFMTIPKELRPYFKDRTQLKRSTKTSDLTHAKAVQHDITTAMRAELDAARPDPLQKVADLMSWSLDELKAMMRDDPERLERMIIGQTVQPFIGEPEEDRAIISEQIRAEEAYKLFKATTEEKETTTKAPKLSEVAEEFFASKPYDKLKTEMDAKLSVGQFIEFAGDLPVDQIETRTGNRWHDSMSGLAYKTIKKKSSYISRLLDWSVRKDKIERNPFRDITIDYKLGTPTKHFIPFEQSELHELFALSMPDHLKTLLTTLMVTGCRLDEITLLEWDEVKVKDGIKYFDLTKSIVKTTGSKRLVPCPTVIEHLYPVVAGKTGQVFPQFKRDADGKAQSPASKALMKYVRKVTPDRQKVVHSLRGNLKDLLRDAGVPEDVNNFITGHSSGDVAGSYGSGPSLKVRADALNSVEHPWLRTR
ncbi:hypothetical protein C1J05_10055 [Sulfitobacter sp. JL08]|uniref:DUF6538 domain-containing protein n=1 Tax=Sulfitobacter sp. JL08 TaxID=2070369 RepID=UPI000E0BB931|nr:DUF6538 domain-containing protein [Sulfitobacter sp. JL08]AXI54795.1 hypothetical protein C1J05_10055 [Sulfitobacter sp. JL08]